MSFQTFTCCECGKTDITKKNSYAIEGKGRACREHEVAQKAREDQIAFEKNIEELKNRKKKETSHRFEGHEAKDYFHKLRNPRTFCWHCDQDGVEEHLIAANALEAMIKNEINKEDQRVDSVDHAKAIDDLVSIKALKWFEIDANFADWKVKQIVPERAMQELARLIKLFIVCRDCCNKFELDWNWQTRDLDFRKVVVIGSAIVSEMKAEIRTNNAIDDMKSRNSA